MTDSSLFDLYSALAKAHAEENIYSKLGAGFASAQPVQTDNPWANLAEGLVQGLLGGGLGAYGRNQEKAYAGDLGNALNALKLGQSPSLTDTFGAEDLANAQGAFSIFDRSNKIEQENILQESLLKAKGETKGKLEGQLEQFSALKGSDGKVDGKSDDSLKQAVLDTTDIGKAARDRELKGLDAINNSRDYLSKEGGDLKGIQQAYDTIAKNIALDTPAAKLSVFNALAKLDDPAGAITAGSFEAARQALPALQQRYGPLAQVFGNDLPLDEPTKKAILEAATNRANVFVSQFNPVAEREATKLQQLQLDPKLAGAETRKPFELPASSATTATLDKGALDAATAALMKQYGGDTVRVKSELLQRFPGVFAGGR